VPGKPDYRFCTSLDVLDDVFFQEEFRHTKGMCSRIKPILLEVVTIAAVEIAYRSGRLDKNLEIAGSFSHILGPSLGEIPEKV
jgi:hypothetical protein